jgi:hypothetical protein
MPIRRTSSGSSQATGFYNPEIFSDVGSRLVFSPDPDAAAYINAVESADGQDLEYLIKVAYNDFVLGCKSDGIWNAIKASCIMAGARTLAGALTPLVGTAPTNNNFVAGDYDRETGLVGDGSTKYVDSNRASDADPQNSQHQAVFLSSAGTTTAYRTHIGTTYTSNAADFTDIFALNDNKLAFRNRNGYATFTSNFFAAPAGSTVDFLGTSRAASNNFDLRYAGSTTNISSSPENVSYTPSTSNHFIFARNSSPANLFSDARICFYSIGESLDLALLDSRVSTLVADIAAAIP